MVADKEKLCKEQLQHSCKTNIGKTTVKGVERGSGGFRRKEGRRRGAKDKELGRTAISHCQFRTSGGDKVTSMRAGFRCSASSKEHIAILDYPS